MIEAIVIILAIYFVLNMAILLMCYAYDQMNYNNHSWKHYIKISLMGTIQVLIETFKRDKKNEG